MRKGIKNLGLAIAVCSSTMLSPNTALPAAQPQAGSGQVAAGSTPLTDADVIRMEQAILNAIRSRPAKFDLSPAGLAALHQAGISDTVLNAMEQAERQAQANAKPPVSAGVAPRPVRPGFVPGQLAGKPSPQGVNALLAQARSIPVKAGPIVTNPAAGQANAPILSLLRQQKQTAMIQRSQAPSPAAHPASPVYVQASVARTAVRAATPPAPSGPNRAALGSQGSILVACATFGSPIIQAVSGQSGSTAVFTQDPAYNPFTIRGCNFGNVAGRAQLNLPNGAMLANLRIDSWTDNQITVEVDPGLTNVLDQNNVTLVLFPPNKPQGQKPGFRFYAMRREILLTSIPSNRKNAQVSVTNDDSGRRVSPYFSAPYRGLAFAIAAQAGISPSQVSPNIDQGWTAGVDRVNAVRFPAGTDVFSFNGLDPGFVLEKFQIDERNIVVCHAGGLFYIGAALEAGVPGIGVGNLKNAISSQGVTNYSDGTWNASINQNTIRVNWAEGHCHATDGNDSSNSSYALHVWVVGPVLRPGTSPWQQSGGGSGGGGNGGGGGGYNALPVPSGTGGGGANGGSGTPVPRTPK
ncbi:MAG TPA: hypothetical protein VGV68_04065 [Terriglobia bacterium]|nr:hypothetical protein [Terriglobia bacterium]